MDRRDFFKFFGVGATVAAMQAGTSSIELPQARIIEPPKVEIIPPPKLIPVDHLPNNEILSIDVNIHCKDGRRFHMAAQGIVTQYRHPLMDVTTYRDNSRKKIPGIGDYLPGAFPAPQNPIITFEVTGPFPHMVLTSA